MTPNQHNKFLRENVKPLSIASSKIKLERCPQMFLKPKDNYFTKSYDGAIIKWEYMPCSKTYRSDVVKLINKGLLYVEKTEDLIIFKHNNDIQYNLFK